MIISIINTKGGVGKTVTSINLGAALATLGKRVLLVDADMQAGLTGHFNLEATPGLTTADVLSGAVGLEECVVSIRERLDIIPGTAEIERAERELIGASGGEVRLRRAFKTADLKYDFVLIDCPSGWGPVSRNAVLASKSIIVPVNSEPAAITCAVSTVEEVDLLGNYYDHEVAVCGILLTRYRHTNAARVVEATSEKKFGSTVFQTRIRQAEKVNELALRGETTSDGRAGGVADDYAALAREVLERTS